MARTGVQPDETRLTPANVNAQHFGKVFTLPVDGDVYAQPLYLSQYVMSDGLPHNVLIVATAEDNVYAFDADGNNPPQGYLWRQSLLAPGETWISDTDVNSVDINPNIGIIGTPVVDRAGGVLYVVAASKNTSGATPVFTQRLHALNIADGTEKRNGPTVIAATVPGTGNGGTTVSFDPLLQNQRAALLLAPTPGVGSGNSVFIAWGSHGDHGDYHGWVMAYDAADISQQNGAWITTPNGIGGGIWMSGGGLSSDGQGNIFAGSGNGLFDADENGGDYGDSAFRLTLSPSGLQLADSFTPADQQTLDSGDHDMAMSALLLLPPETGPVPNLTITADKSGTLYLLNRDNMGGYGTPENSSLQSFSTGYRVHSSAAFFNNTLYLGLDNGPLQSWTLNPATDQLVPQSATTTIFTTPAYSGGGGTPSISANGTANAIVWIIQDTQYNYGPAVLHAYNAADLSQELYNSQQAANGRDTAAIAVKFTTPTIANGRVYVGGRNAVTVYGLLSTIAPPAPAATPSIQPAAGTYTAPQSVTIADATPNASIYYTTTGDDPTTSSTLYTGPIPVTQSETISAIAIAPGYAQSSVATAAYTIAQPAPTQLQVPLSSSANAIGFFNDGASLSSTGLDGAGHAWSANQVGSSITLFGANFTLGAPAQNDVVIPANAPVIPLPSASASELEFLGAAIHSNQNGVPFTVTYTDGSKETFTQNMSAWNKPENHSGESIAYSGTYYDTSSGGEVRQKVYLYRYAFHLDSAKTLKSFAPAANSNIAIAAVSLYGLAAAPSPVTATPAIQPAAGTYTSSQTVTLTDATPNASIFYTTDGTGPTASSTLYTGPIQVAQSETVKAVAAAPGYAQSEEADATYTIGQSGPIPTLPQVSLTPYANAIGLFEDGVALSSAGLDGAGHAWSANQIGGSIALWGVKFILGAPGQNNVVIPAGAPVIALPQGSYSELEFLGSAIHSNQNGVLFTVTYSDGSVETFAQNMSAWNAPENHSGESIAYSGTYYDTSSGGEVRQKVYLYRYAFHLDSGKTVQSFTLPDNSNLAIVAISMLGS